MGVGLGVGDFVVQLDLIVEPIRDGLAEIANDRRCEIGLREAVLEEDG